MACYLPIGAALYAHVPCELLTRMFLRVSRVSLSLQVLIEPYRRINNPTMEEISTTNPAFYGIIHA